MKTLGMTLPLLMLMWLVPSAQAQYQSCRWTAEGTNPEFAKDPVYSKPPMMVNSSYCASGDAKGKEIKPVCFGYVYCESGSSIAPPQAVTVACEAAKVAGKWKCPSAWACADDSNVDMVTMLNTPRVTGGGSSDGGGGAIREGVGGR